MRPTSRIPFILAQLRIAWDKYPDMRLGQLIMNITRPLEPKNLFYIEDDVLSESLIEFTREMPRMQPRETTE